MSTTTTYDVALRFRLDDQAAKGTDALAHKLGAASYQANELSHVLTHVGAIAGSYMGIHGAWEHLVKFNEEVENAKISLTAMVEGGFGGSFQYAKAQAESLYAEFQKFSQQTPMTTQEMLEFSRGVAVSVQQAGGSIRDITNITEQGAIAAKALGMESHYAAREISELLAGNISNRMLFVKQLAGMGGTTPEALRQMSEQQRLQFLRSTLNSPAMKDAVGSMSTSFAGVTSTLVDKLQILMGKVGLPLFRAITAEVSRWNEWIDKNQVSIDQFAHQVATGLVEAFSTVKDVFSFIYDHADVFLAIGKTWAAIKIGGMLGSAAGGLLGMGGGLGGNISGIAGFGKAIGPAAAAGVGAYELAKAAGLDTFGEKMGSAFFEFTHGTDSLGMRFDRLEKSSAVLDQAFRDAASSAGHMVSTNVDRLQGVANTDAENARLLTGYLQALRDTKYGDDFQGATKRASSYVQQLADRGIDTSGNFSDLVAMRDKLTASSGALEGKRDLIGLVGGGLLEALERSSLTEYQRDTLNEQKAMDEIFGQINQRLHAGGTLFDPAFVGELLKTLRENTADPEGRHKKIAEKPKVNVTIHRIEVQSDDPDRLAFGLVRAFRDAAKNPSSALATLREG